MIENIEIRKATLKDMGTLQALLEQLGYPLSQQDIQEKIDLYTNKDEYGIIIAQVKENIAGLLAWSQQELFVENKVRIHIEALIVDKKWQKQGIGKALLSFLENSAMPFRNRILDLTSGFHRASTGTHNFYKKQGFENQGNNKKVYLRKEILVL